MAPPGINKSLDEVVDAVRLYLGDTPEENKLIPGFELSRDKLKLAVTMAIDEFNNHPPYTSFRVETFPSLTILMHGAIVQCLIMAGLVQSRNFLSFSDGGISEQISDRAPQYQSWIQTVTSMIGNYREETKNIKININMEEGFGVITSPISTSRFNW